MTRLRSGALAAWASAWLAGRAAFDDVLHVTIGGDGAHRVAGLPDADGLVPLGAVLIEWRRSARAVRLVLPVPGDVRGVPGPSAFRAAALDAGEAVFGGALGLVPQVAEHSISSAPTTVTWHAYLVDAPPPDPLCIPDAQHELGEAIRSCASTLAAADVAACREDVTEALADARRAGERLDLPPGFPPPAASLLAQAERLHAVLRLAALDPIGGAVDRRGIAARADALRPLATAVRRARLAGYNAGC